MNALQVMADAADLCCHTLLHHCHSPKLLRSLCDVVRTDKNSKIRLCCAKYLLQASPWCPWAVCCQQQWCTAPMGGKPRGSV